MKCNDICSDLMNQNDQQNELWNCHSCQSVITKSPMILATITKWIIVLRQVHYGRPRASLHPRKVCGLRGSLVWWLSPSLSAHCSRHSSGTYNRTVDTRASIVPDLLHVYPLRKQLINGHYITSLTMSRSKSDWQWGREAGRKGGREEARWGAADNNAQDQDESSNPGSVLKDYYVCNFS